MSVCIDRYFNLFVTAGKEKNINKLLMIHSKIITFAALTGSQIYERAMLIDPQKGGATQLIQTGARDGRGV